MHWIMSDVTRILNAIDGGNGIDSPRYNPDRFISLVEILDFEN